MKCAQKHNAFTLMELLIVVGIFFVIFAALAPFVRMAKTRANRIACARNLMKLSLGLHRYAFDNDDRFPPDLTVLYPGYVKDRGAFDCPASKKAGTPQKPDYDYIAGLTEASPQKEIIASDLEGNHRKAGKNILRVGGTVEWVSGAR